MVVNCVCNIIINDAITVIDTKLSKYFWLFIRLSIINIRKNCVIAIRKIFYLDLSKLVYTFFDNVFKLPKVLKRN
jgi:hypothetical protein